MTLLVKWWWTASRQHYCLDPLMSYFLRRQTYLVFGLQLENIWL